MAVSKTKIGAVEVRAVDTEYGETGVGVSNRTETEYQLGVDIDGAFVPFVTVQKGRAEMFQARAEAEAEAEAKKPTTPARAGA